MWFQDLNKRFYDNAMAGNAPLRLELETYQKLEEYWQTKQPGFQLDISRLQINHRAYRNGEMCWRVIGTYLLNGRENGGNHHVYFDLIDEKTGNRLMDGGPFAIPFSWEGMNEQEVANLPTTLAEKPPNEVYGNVHISNYDQIVSFPSGYYPNSGKIAGLPSDFVSGITIRIPDSWESGNTMGHWSTYICLMRTDSYNPFGMQTPIPDPDPIPEPDDNSGDTGGNGNGSVNADNFITTVKDDGEYVTIRLKRSDLVRLLGNV